VAGIADLVEALLGCTQIGQVLGERGHVVDEEQRGGGVLVAGEAANDRDQPCHRA
jgi:hypothetical protein